jgi:HAD superfamily hydrolase (TIGR01509 family)
MDGVLINDMPWHVYAWKKALKEYSIKPKDKELYLLEGASNMQFLQYLLDKESIKLTKETMKEIHEQKLKYFAKKGKTKPYKILNYLKRLKLAGIKMAVATGGHKKIAYSDVNEFFPGIFDCIITGDDVKNSKPNPEEYTKAMKKIKAKKSETLVIENAPFGIRAANSAGVNKVYALTTTLNKKYLAEADCIFSNHNKLFKILFKELGIK